jgi:hypothetical protein
VGDESSITLELANSIEFEGELKLRYSSLLQRERGFRIPMPMYIGMFAGSTKPKPFQRKRPNLSNLPSGKLPPLADMRKQALELHKGSFRPCEQGSSRRVQIAMQHIHEGYNSFTPKEARGLPNDVRGMTPQAVLSLTNEAIVFKAEGRNSSSNATYTLPYENIKDWEAKGLNEIGGMDSSNNGIEITLTSGKKVYFGVVFVRDVKHSLEFYWNKWNVENGGVVKHGSTHGRPLVSVSTLDGTAPPPPFPQGSSEVVDQDGMVVRPGNKISARRKSILGSGGDEQTVVPGENREVKQFWHKTVVHQGWLLKKGGIGLGEAKNWIKRYFVLYSTSQGHFLIYYSDFTECPLYTTDRAPRNVVDLAKATFIRPGSNKADFSNTPPHSFDIVTTEREWTLCAESQENVQKWMKILTRAVDEDVAILPDEQLVFKVKPKMDPSHLLNPNDYSTSLKVSANGISVCTPSPANPSQDFEHFFWSYTDFYKWSLLSQNNKLALLVNVFEDSSFSKRNEFIFRNKEAARLATAIEYFIEKFMSVMHIRLELVPGSFDNVQPVAAVLAEPLGERGASGNGGQYASASEWQEAQVVEAQASLLDLDDDGERGAPPSRPSNMDNDLLGAVISTTSESSLGGDEAAATVFGGANDPFGNDPFASGPAANEKTAPPLTQAQKDQHHQWYQQAFANRRGPVYDDGLLQVATKIEVKGSQARITLFYRNKGPSSMSNFSVAINDPSGLLRFELSTTSPQLEALAQSQQILMVECMKPANENPTFTISYTDSLLGKRNNELNLPVNTATFNEPLSLPAADFSTRWEQLQGQGQHKQEVFKPPTRIVPALVYEGMTKSLRFGPVIGMPDESEFVRYGACSLRTGSAGPNGEKISVGCLVKIEMNVQSNAVRVSARTLHPAATLAVFESARSLLF